MILLIGEPTSTSFNKAYKYIKELKKEHLIIKKANLTIPLIKKIFMINHELKDVLSNRTKRSEIMELKMNELFLKIKLNPSIIKNLFIIYTYNTQLNCLNGYNDENISNLKFADNNYQSKQKIIEFISF